MYILKKNDNGTIIVDKRSGKSRLLSKEEEYKIGAKIPHFESEKLIPFHICKQYRDIIEHTITKEYVENSFFIFPESNENRPRS